MAQQTYQGRQGAVYTLGNSIKKGYEGEVFEIAGKPELVAKLYSARTFTPGPDNSDPRQFLREKLETMLDQPVDPYVSDNEGNRSLTVAWPQDALYDGQGQFVGFVMPRVNSNLQLYHACEEHLREKYFPGSSWTLGLTIALNLVVAVKKVQATGAVVGDFNPNNIMLDTSGHVTLIGTDSFHIVNRQTGKVYKCTVGVPELLPPELQGKDLRRPNSVFSTYTDSFSLGLLIFSLLMNDCHPFAFIMPKGHQCDVGANITRGWCPYVSHPICEGAIIPPAAPDIMMLPQELRTLFDRTFTYNESTTKRGETIEARPTIDEWHNALWNLYKSPMVTCRRDPGHVHVYPGSYTKECPWCAVARRSFH